MIFSQRYSVLVIVWIIQSWKSAKKKLEIETYFLEVLKRDLHQDLRTFSHLVCLKLLPLNSIDTSGYKVVDLEAEQWTNSLQEMDRNGMPGGHGPHGYWKSIDVDLRIQSPAVSIHSQMRSPWCWNSSTPTWSTFARRPSYHPVL